MSKHLIVKTSSLGDIVHMLPALTDAAKCIPSASFDWVTESGFSEIPAWHPNVDLVIQNSLRRWRKEVLKRTTWSEFKAFKNALQKEPYSKAIDSQGLVKSAIIARLSQGEAWGYDKHSIRDPFASRLYQHTVSVPYKEHAVTRNRLILAKTLGYSIDSLPLDYGIAGNNDFRSALKKLSKEIKIPDIFVMALHGTSRKEKEWPVENWEQFIQEIGSAGYAILFPWGNNEELARAKYLSEKYEMAITLPRSSLTTLSGLIEKASAVIGMDTGLMHIAAALDKKGIGIYPVTEPKLSGALAPSGLIENIGGDACLVAEDMIAKMKKLL
ncbi:MAG TPA: lipopolysaccharide heptosyltransferase I [Leucothrix sp.]|nr:lipopolysaccharide heptosyltransferase I [Leucothrix sp.]